VTLKQLAALLDIRQDFFFAAEPCRFSYGKHNLALLPAHHFDRIREHFSPQHFEPHDENAHWNPLPAYRFCTEFPPLANARTFLY